MCVAIFTAAVISYLYVAIYVGKLTVITTRIMTSITPSTLKAVTDADDPAGLGFVLIGMYATFVRVSISV